MSNDDIDSPDDALLDHLAASAEALACGRLPSPPTVNGATDGAAASADWQQLVGCLLVLETLRPDAEGESPPVTPPPQIPGFAIGRELGRGGMGVVYYATDLTLRRPVAVKILRAGALGTPDEKARFQTEARAAARLRHPGILPVHSSGEADGLTYLVMEYVDGLSLSQRLAGQPMPPTVAAHLVGALAGAAHYAHQSGVVHRDLKPANVLIGTDGEVRIADFGLAKLLDTEGGQTSAGQMLGTAEYMAPEQTTAGSDTVGPAADIYALGAILYECLTGRPPFRGATVLDTLHQARTSDPVSPRRLNRHVPRDLETVCLACLEKNPGRRYASALELAEDLGRYGRGEVLKARPVGRIGRAVRWCRRFPALAVLLGLLMVVSCTAIVLAITSIRYAHVAAAREDLAERNLYLADMSRIRLAWENGEFGHVGALLGRHRPAPGEPDRRAWEWHYWDRVYHTPKRTYNHSGGVRALAVRPDGARIATAGQGDVKVWETNSGSELLTFDTGQTTVKLAFSPDGRHLYTIDRRVCRWNAETGSLVRVLHHSTSAFASLDVAPDGRRIVVTDRSSAHVLDSETGDVIRTFPAAGAVNRVALQPVSGKCLAFADRQGLTVYDLTTGVALWKVPGAFVANMSFFPDGSHLAVQAEHGPYQLFDAASGQVVPESLLATDLGAIVFGPDRLRYAVANPNAGFTVWNVAKRPTSFDFHGHDRSLCGLAFVGDNRTIVSAAEDGTAKLWDAVDPDVRLVAPPDAARYFHVAFRPDGKEIAAGDDRGRIRRWDLTTNDELLPSLPSPASQTYALAYGPSGQLAAAGGDPESTELKPFRIHVWDSPASPPRVFDGSTKWVWSLAFHPDGRRLASAGSEKLVRIWDLDTGQTIRTLRGFDSRVVCVAFSPDGRHLATACGDHLIRVFDASDNGPSEPTQTLIGHTDEVFAVDYSRDGRWLASGGWDRTARLWDAAAGRLVRTFAGHSDHVWSVAFAPDGRRLATTGEDGSVRLFDVATGEEVLAVRDRFTPTFFNVAFSPDSGHIAACGRDVIRMLDGRPLP